MIRIEEAIELDAPAERAFDVVANVEAYPTWLPGVLRAEPLPDGAVALTATGPGGIAVSAVGRTVTHDPPRTIAISASSPLFALAASCAIEPLGPARCRVTVTAELEPRGLATLAAGRIEQELRAAAPDALARLRAAVEMDEGAAGT